MNASLEQELQKYSKQEFFQEGDHLQLNDTTSNLSLVRLPIEIIGLGDLNLLKKAGVVFFGPVKDAPSLQYAKLPTGWFLKALDIVEFVLIDSMGQKRARIMTDNKSYGLIELCTRFVVHPRPRRDCSETVVIVCVYDGNKELFCCGPRALNTGDYRSKIIGDMFAEAEAWLEKEFPNWRDPGMYWG